MLASLLVAALLSAAQEGPISTARGTEETAQQLARREAIAYAAPLPPEIPSDDLAFVGWCLGHVTGHIETGRFLKHEDQELLDLAEVERRRFADALQVAAARDPKSVAAAEAARAGSQAKWAEVRQQQPVWMKFAYEASSGLPGRCEHAARRVTANIKTPPATLAATEAAAPRTATAEPPLPTGNPRTTP
jgi:hypothetical protein